MFYFLNLAINLLFPGLIEWWSRWSVASTPISSPEPDDYARAIAAITGILILGLGGVLIIGLSGRWIRRLLFKIEDRPAYVSPDSVMGKMDWAKSPKSVDTHADSNDQHVD